MSNFTQGFEKRASLMGSIKSTFQNIKTSVKPKARIPVPSQSPSGMRINPAPELKPTPAAPPGPFEALRQKATSPGNMAKMRVGGLLVGGAGLTYGGVKAMDWATGNEPTRPDW